MRREPARSNGSPLPVLLLITAYAAVHSLFASRCAKKFAQRMVGTRSANGLYRVFFVTQATVSTAIAIRLFRRLPDRELYHAAPPCSYGLAAIQSAGVALLAKAVSTVGFGWLLGLQNAIALVRGEESLPMPEAQGPRVTSDGEVDAQGPFRYIRHPDNLPIVVILWSFRRMTVNRLVLAIVSSVYAVLGSWHEDRRLIATYGTAFQLYRRRVPMMIPDFLDRRRASSRSGERAERAAESSREGPPVAEVHHEFAEADGVTLHVARAGEGPAVILLHGFPENWRSWRHQIPALVRAGFSVWAPDLRGYHLSSRPSARDAYHLRHLVADVAALVRATGQKSAHIVGHDWGGVIAWTFAGMHPELTRKLIVLNAPHMRLYRRQVRWPRQMFRSWYVLFFQLRWFAERTLSANNFQIVRSMFRHLPARRGTFSKLEIDAYIDALAKPGALTAALNYYRANFQPDAVQLASSARVTAETLVIWGVKDAALSVGLLNGLEEVAPRVQVQRLPHAGHWVQNEAPGEVNRLALTFLGDSELSPPFDENDPQLQPTLR